MNEEFKEDQENENKFKLDSKIQYQELKEEPDWKPVKHQTYETMVLQVKQGQIEPIPRGFRENNKPRRIKNTCLISKLRTQCLQKKEKLKLAVCITMYNEEKDLLKKTLTGVIHNYNELRNDPDLNFKKQDFIVFLVCDGYDRIPETFKEYASEIGFFEEETLIDKGFLEKTKDGKYKMKEIKDLMSNKVDEKEYPRNILHMFQLQTRDFGLDDLELEGRRLNFVFAIKHRNDGKINSHKWFFQGLCNYLEPELCMMLDIGTQPDQHSIYKLYKYMINNKNCGGCCGEIEVDFSDKTMSPGTYLIRAAQFFEYKQGHAPDKANESFFGFNSVLPGAYSMFRYKAIQGEPLTQFFRGSNDNKVKPTCAEANEFLAEDRIMCLQIYIKKNERFYLCYIPDAKAKTDAPESLAILIKQRRRWMNGSTFGSTKVISHFIKIISCRRTKHPWYRQIGMAFYLIYYILQSMSQFFTVGSMYASISVFLKQSFKSMMLMQKYDLQVVTVITNLFDYFYIFLVLMTIIVSLTMPVDRGAPYFKFLMVVFGFLLMFTMAGIVIYLINTGFWPQVSVSNDKGYSWEPVPDQYYFSILTLSGVIMMTVFIMPMLLRPFDFLSNFRLYIIGLFSYIFMMPTFINIMAIYSMCNLHDISWGNRPTDGNEKGMQAVAAREKDQQALGFNYELYRAHMVYMWLCLNALYGGISATISTTNTSTVQDGSIGFIEGFSLFIAGLVVFKFIFALIYTVKWNFRMWTNSKYRKSNIDVEEIYKQLYKDRKVSTDDDEPAFPGSYNSQDPDDQRRNTLMRLPQNQLIDYESDDDPEVDKPNEEELKDNFALVSKNRRETILKSNLQPMATRIININYSEANDTATHNTQSLICDTEEYDHDNPDGGDYLSNSQSIGNRQLGAEILKEQKNKVIGSELQSGYFKFANSKNTKFD